MGAESYKVFDLPRIATKFVCGTIQIQAKLLRSYQIWADICASYVGICHAVNKLMTPTHNKTQPKKKQKKRNIVYITDPIHQHDLQLLDDALTSRNSTCLTLVSKRVKQ
jgi:hypothetical protein